MTAAPSDAAPWKQTQSGAEEKESPSCERASSTGAQPSLATDEGAATATSSRRCSSSSETTSTLPSASSSKSVGSARAKGARTGSRKVAEAFARSATAPPATTSSGSSSGGGSAADSHAAPRNPGSQTQRPAWQRPRSLQAGSQAGGGGGRGAAAAAGSTTARRPEAESPRISGSRLQDAFTGGSTKEPRVTATASKLTEWVPALTHEAEKVTRSGRVSRLKAVQRHHQQPEPHAAYRGTTPPPPRLLREAPSPPSAFGSTASRPAGNHASTSKLCSASTDDSCTVTVTMAPSGTEASGGPTGPSKPASCLRMTRSTRRPRLTGSSKRSNGTKSTARAKETSPWPEESTRNGGGEGGSAAQASARGGGGGAAVVTLSVGAAEAEAGPSGPGSRFAPTKAVMATDASVEEVALS
mmetsp:Transcript_40826/g.131295  ORF Transcript_40826/g.131295 Transcript_40826/m.131295 type:complete len:413 (+) Transcript_40826:181-1419(+)